MSKLKELFTRDIKINTRYYFTALESIYLILNSGQDLLTAVSSAKEDVDEKRLNRILDAIYVDLKNGASFSSTLKNHRLLPTRLIQIIRVGEENGILGKTLQIVIEQYKHEKELSAKVQAASIYPLIVLVVAFVVGVGISWFVLPQLATVYTSFNQKIPLITQIMISWGNIVRSQGYWIFPTMGIISALIPVFSTLSLGFRRFTEKIIFSIGPIRKLLMETEMSRFGYIFGSLLNVGITVDKALKSMVDATPYLIYKEIYNDMLTSLELGSSFSMFFNSKKVNKKLFATSVKHLIMSAEKSGSMPEVMLQVGQSFQGRMEKTSENLTRILEPILLIVMWVFVAILAIGIILPIYSQLGNLQY